MKQIKAFVHRQRVGECLGAMLRRVAVDQAEQGDHRPGRLFAEDQLRVAMAPGLQRRLGWRCGRRHAQHARRDLQRQVGDAGVGLVEPLPGVIERHRLHHRCVGRGG